MRVIHLFAVIVVLWLVAADCAVAQTGGLTAESAWIRVVPGSNVASAYLTLRNRGNRTLRVTGVASPLATHAMIHETSLQNGQSQMRARDELKIQPGQVVTLSPGGLHVMLHGLTRIPAVGESVPLVLTLGDGGLVRVTAVVRPLTAQ